MERNRDHGGISAIITGRMGSGKTTFMLSKLAVPLLKKREILLWHGQESCQWTYIDPVHVKLLLDPMYKYILLDRESGEELDLSSLQLKYIYASDPEEFYRYSEPHKLNVFYMDEDKFVGFLKYLNLRADIQWISIFYDEIEKLAPSNVEADMWRRNKRLADELADTRKNYISFYATAHDLSDVDYRVTRKMIYKVYLQDARIPRDSRIRFKMLSHKLHLGEAIIEGSTFKKTVFDRLSRKMNLVMKIRGVEDGGS